MQILSAIFLCFGIVLSKSYVIINIEVMKNFLQWEVGNMGIYLNPTNESFQEAINSEIYVDKSGLISFTNKSIKTGSSLKCVGKNR